MLAAVLGTLALLQATPSPIPHPSSPLSPFARAKAEALLRDHLPCLGCHELDGTGGRVGPTLSRLGRERARAFVLAMIRDPQRTITGTSMPRIPLDDSTSELIARYLVERAPTRPPAPSWPGRRRRPVTRAAPRSTPAPARRATARRATAPDRTPGSSPCGPPRTPTRDT